MLKYLKFHFTAFFALAGFNAGGTAEYVLID